MQLLNYFSPKYGNQQKLSYAFGYLHDFFHKIGCKIYLGNAEEFKEVNNANSTNRWYILPEIFLKNPRFFSVLIYQNEQLVATSCFAPMDRHKNISIGETLLFYPEHYWDDNAKNNNIIQNIPEELFYMFGDVSYVFGLWFHKKILMEFHEYQLIEHLSLLLKILILGKENPDYCYFLLDPISFKSYKGKTLLDKYNVHYHTNGPYWNGLVGKSLEFESAWIDRVSMIYEIEQSLKNHIKVWPDLHFQTLLHNRYEPL